MASKVKVNENLKGNIDILFDLFGEVGIESFVVTFDGGGDSGQVEDPCDFNPEKSKEELDVLLSKVVEGAKISDGTRWGPNGSEELWKYDPTLNELISSLCYDTLESVYGGWEINEGSHGTFTFDVKKRKVILDFNERVIEDNHTQYVL